MAYNKINTLLESAQEIFNPTAGSSSGSTVYVPAPFRGYLTEVAFMPRATITSDTTLRATVAQFISSTASLLTEVISSTLGTFNSVQLVAGNYVSVQPPSPTFVNFGDTIGITTSGGNSSLTGATIIAQFRKG